MFKHSVACPHCDENITRDWAEYVTDSDVIDEDRGMGCETAHTIECDSFECPHCHKEMQVNGTVYEYPEGAYNYHEISAE